MGVQIDPLRHFTHSHAQLTRRMGDVTSAAQADREHFVAALELLRDELLEHFAYEEEGLFPFLREHLPAKVDVVVRLESAHDALCAAVVRLAELAAGTDATVLDELQRFEVAYAAHSREEASLLGGLAADLPDAKRRELAALLAGL